MVHLLFKNILFVPKLDNLFRYLIGLCLLYITFILCRNVVINISRYSFNKGLNDIFMAPHDLLIKENNKNITYLYYRQATSARNSSYPFITGDTFRAFSDFTFDEVRRDKFDSLKYGDIIFVKGDSLQEFFDIAYRTIRNSFVLVSHNSDYSAPAEYATKLQDKQIIAWYGSNPSLKYHSKLFPIPIGFENSRWPGGKLHKLMYGFEKHRKPWSSRTTLLYVNFNVNTNKEQRAKALAQAKLFKNVQIIDKRISFETYLEQIGNAKFVLSPPGNGLDCHRTWEALLLGAAPVVLTSGLDPLYKNIPTVIINDWANLTEDFLLSYNFQSYDNLMPTVLYARYWREKLYRYRSTSYG